MDKLLSEHINSGMIKIYLLSYGVRIDTRTLKLISECKDIQENRYYYNTSNELDLCKNYNIPSEILLPDDVVSSIYLNENSPLQIKQVNKDFQLFFGNEFLCNLDFNKKTKFFSKKLTDGSACNKYCSMYGKQVLAFFLDSNCAYANTNLSCKFCSLRPTRNSIGSKNEKVISINRLQEILELIKEDIPQIKYVMYTAGTYGNVDVGIDIQAKFIKKVVKFLGNQNICHHLTTMPPKNGKKLQALKTIGLNSIAFDLEVFNKDLFNHYCPGKEKYFGYDKLIGSFDDALKVFGKNNVKAGFVGGLEPIDSLEEGMNYFGQKGISIAINVFHPDPNTALGNMPRPTTQYLVDMVKGQRDIYQKYGLVPVFPEGGRRSSLDTEVYRGLFNNL